MLPGNNVSLMKVVRSKRQSVAASRTFALASVHLALSLEDKNSHLPVLPGERGPRMAEEIPARPFQPVRRRRKVAG
jgi:hypothetical protein